MNLENPYVRTAHLGRGKMTEADNLKYFMNMMEAQKVIEFDRDAFRFTPSFAHILISSFKQHSAASGLALAVKSYCNPGTGNTELAVISTGVMTMLRLGENPMFHEIQAELNRDIPPGMFGKANLKAIVDMVEKERKKK